MNQLAAVQKTDLPEGFVYVHDVLHSARISPRYYMDDNFTGRQTPGYNAPVVIITEVVAERLKEAAAIVAKNGFDFVIYDGYRPQRAVDSWGVWANDLSDQLMQETYYPRLDKRDVFGAGYLAKLSQHSRGAAIDLSLIKKENAAKPSVPVKRTLTDGSIVTHLDDGSVDMYTHFDLFDDASHHDTLLIPAEYLQWRNYLREVMVSVGFQPYKNEWWHYSVKDEPFPDTYFDFLVE